MDARDFTLLSLEAFDGKVNGRTLFQKRLYFLAALARREIEFGFRAHYYGPYSSAVADALGELKALGFVEETRIPLQGEGTRGFERNRFEVKLTDAGQRLAEHRMKSLDEQDSLLFKGARQIKALSTANDYAKASIAAKVHYITVQKGEAWDTRAAADEARKYKWSLDPGAAEEAAAFLEKLNLIRVDPSEST